MNIATFAASLIATIKALWVDGSPFAGVTALWPTDESGKYVIQAEGIRLAFTNHGGALANLWINDTNGNEIDIVLGFDHAKDYLSYGGNTYLGGAIGRYAGVISGASFQLDGAKYNVSTNGNGGAALNGGERGWGQLSFDIVSHTENTITFVVFDREGKSGFPGTAASCLTHTVLPYEWRIAYGVTPSRTSSAMPINLSHQVFWNLDGFAANSTKTIANHTLHLPFSGLRLETDQDGIPTGDIKGNKLGSKYDFWSATRPLGRGLNNVDGEENGYNDAFLISRSQPWDKDTHPVATLASPHSGITVDLYTDEEALHMLTWNEPHGAITLKQGQGETEAPQYAGVSLQMQDWTDAINRPEWQRGRKIFWAPDRIYTSYSKFKFSVK
ncbi:MAG: hypothetical protein M1839_003166 [Geoglossum umbratile]|nr:MAG: hypothetical protein M1839_003166 [Geoglossum umbratile]